MKKKNETKKAPLKIVNDALDITENAAKKANSFALYATEELVTETLHVVGQWQNVANKAINGSLKLASTNQDIVFDTLNGLKSQLTLGKKRYNKLMA